MGFYLLKSKHHNPWKECSLGCLKQGTQQNPNSQPWCKNQPYELLLTALLCHSITLMPEGSPRHTDSCRHLSLTRARPAERKIKACCIPYQILLTAAHQTTVSTQEIISWDICSSREACITYDG